MLVKIKKTCEHTGIKEGEIYEACSFDWDSSKVALLQRIPDGKDPECTEYLYNVEIIPTISKLED